jgi:uncharacterized membrane protein
MFARKSAYAVLLSVFAAVFSYLTALMLTNRGATPEVAPEYGLPFSLVVIALIALIVAVPCYFIFELTPKKSYGAGKTIAGFKVSHFVIGAILVVASVGAISGYETATSSIAEKKKAVEAEKRKVVEQKESEEIEKRKAEKQKAKK